MNNDVKDNEREGADGEMDIKVGKGEFVNA